MPSHRWIFSPLSYLVRAWKGLLLLSIRIKTRNSCWYQKLVILRLRWSLMGYFVFRLIMWNTIFVRGRPLSWLWAAFLLLKLRLSFVINERALILYGLLMISYSRNSYSCNLSRLKLGSLFSILIDLTPAFFRFLCLLLWWARRSLTLLTSLLLTLLCIR